MEEPEVRSLVERAQRGDEDAFAALYAELAPRVLRYLRYRVADPDRAEELMQETFVKAVEGLPRYRTRDRVPFAAWIFRIARNTMVDDHRAARPTLDLDAVSGIASSADGPAEVAEADLEREALGRALDLLHPSQRDVLVYRFFAGLRPAEVASLMSRSDGAVRVLQHRALAALRQILERQVSGELARVAR